MVFDDTNMFILIKNKHTNPFKQKQLISIKTHQVRNDEFTEVIEQEPGSKFLSFVLFFFNRTTINANAFTFFFCIL